MAEKINIEQIFLSDAEETNSYPQIYLANPEKKFLEKFGRLAILVDLDLRRGTEEKTFSQIRQWAQSLIDFIKNNFYGGVGSIEEIEKKFENMLQRTNEWLRQEKIKPESVLEEYIAGLNVGIIALLDKNIYLSQIGEIKSYLIQTSSSDKDEEDAVQEIAEGQGGGKLIKFSNLTSGTLEENSILLFAAKNLFDYLPLKKISQTLKETSIKKATARIKQLLSDENVRANLLALIISNRDESFSVEKNANEIDEKDEEDFRPKQKEKTTSSKKTLSGKKTDTAPDLPAKKEIIEILKPTEHKMLHQLKVVPSSGNKNKKQKILLIVLFIFAVLFIQSLIALSKQEAKNRQEEKYAQLAENIKNKETELSVALIYPDQENSEKLFIEIRQLLEQMPQETQEQRENYQILHDQYSQRLNQFYHLTILNNLEPLIDLKTIDEKVETGGLTNIGDNFYIFNSENNYIYFYNLKTKEAKIVNDSSANVGRLKKIVPLDDDNLVGYDQNQGLEIFNTIDNKLTPLKLESSHSPSGVKDLTVYGGRIYLLEPDNNQIYKYSKTIDGFGKEESWLQDQTSIAGAFSLTIDGSIYLLKTDGQILKFYKNKREEFLIDNLQPPLSVQNPNLINSQQKTKIFTDADKTYLYILDGPSQRLILLSKQGKLIKQFSSPLFDDLKDFIVSRNESRIWLLSGSKIFEITLE